MVFWDVASANGTWTCGCGHVHRYEQVRIDEPRTLIVTCPGCRQTATLRAAGDPDVPDIRRSSRRTW
jgi:hypothetical protein